MIYERDKHAKLLERLSANELVQQLAFGRGTLMLMAGAARGAKHWTEARQQFLTEMKETANAAGLQWDALEPMANQYAASIKREWPRPPAKHSARAPKSDDAERFLSGALRAARTPLIGALKAIPNSVEKALGALAHGLGRSAASEDEFGFPEVVQVLASSESRLVGIHRKRIRQQVLTNASIQSPRYWDTEWSVAWLRHAERHELPHGRGYIEQESQELEEFLRDQLGNVWKKPTYAVPCPDFRGALRLCWICSFSHSLRARVEQLVGGALNAILSWQNPNGGWPDPEQTRAVGCCETAAFAASCLQRYGDGARWHDPTRRAISWLLVNPNEGGGWGDARRLGGVGSLNIVATVAALDAMRVEGIPLEHPGIQAAEGALLQQQHYTGLWVDHRGNADEYLTALVVGYFQRREQRLSRMHEASGLGRGLLLKAQAMQVRVYAMDQMLALVALYHGLEYVVYGFLIEHGVPVRKSDGRTIGLDEALSQLKLLAQSSGWIGPRAGLPYSTEIAELKARRDEVIHRMGHISPDAVEKFTAVVWKFVERFDVPILGFTLLD